MGTFKNSSITSDTASGNWSAVMQRLRVCVCWFVFSDNRI